MSNVMGINFSRLYNQITTQETVKPLGSGVYPLLQSKNTLYSLHKTGEKPFLVPIILMGMPIQSHHNMETNQDNQSLCKQML